MDAAEEALGFNAEGLGSRVQSCMMHAQAAGEASGFSA